MENSEDSPIDIIPLATKTGKKKLIRKKKSHIESNPELEDWVDDLKADLYTPDGFNQEAGSLNPPFQTQTIHSSPEGASSPIAQPTRDEIHFFDEDTFKFSVTPEPSPVSFEHWEVSNDEKDFNWDKYKNCSEATKKRCMREQGKLCCVGAPLHPYLRKVIEMYDVAPLQLSLNSYKLVIALLILYHDLEFPTPIMKEVSHFFSLRKSDHDYYYLVVDSQHNKKGFSAGKISHLKRWKEPFFYLYDAPRIRIRLNTNPSKDAPYLTYFFPSFSQSNPNSFFSEKLHVKQLFGATKQRADAVLKIAAKRFNLKTLIIEENLKRVGILSDKVGTKCKYRKFRGGVPILSDSEESGDDNLHEENTESKSPRERITITMLLILVSHTYICFIFYCIHITAFLWAGHCIFVLTIRFQISDMAPKIPKSFGLVKSDKSVKDPKNDTTRPKKNIPKMPTPPLVHKWKDIVDLTEYHSKRLRTESASSNLALNHLGPLAYVFVKDEEV